MPAGREQDRQHTQTEQVFDVAERSVFEGPADLWFAVAVDLQRAVVHSVEDPHEHLVGAATQIPQVHIDLAQAHVAPTADEQQQEQPGEQHE